MNRLPTLVWTAIVAALALGLLVPPAEASAVTHPDRESTYPAGVQNVTHTPWAPRPGEDIMVTLTLAPDAKVPSRADLLFCRVEPNYVCTARPPQMEPDETKRVWTATVAWDDRFMTEETDHVGYNLTMRFPDPTTDTGVRRVAAPLGNHWVPETYPEGTDGRYYFVRYDGVPIQQESPAPAFLSIVLIAALAALGSRRFARGDRRV